MSPFFSNPLPFPFPVSIKPKRNIIAVSTAGSSAGAASNGPGGFKISSTVATQTDTIVADAVVRERHDDELVLTEQPVETGATITDHAYKLPAKLELLYAWALGSNQNTLRDPTFLNNLYQKLLGFQVNRTLLTVNTGKRVYNNMVAQRIATESDEQNENVLMITLSLQEVLMATTQVVSNNTDPSTQEFPDQTLPLTPRGTLSLQPAPNFNAGAL